MTPGRDAEKRDANRDAEKRDAFRDAGSCTGAVREGLVVPSGGCAWRSPNPVMPSQNYIKTPYFGYL